MAFLSLFLDWTVFISVVFPLHNEVNDEKKYTGTVLSSFEILRSM